MKIGILGSGDVGKALARGFIAESHEVFLATREPEGEKGVQLQTDVASATICDFATAAKEAELAVFAVKWDGAQEMIGLIGPENLAGKIVIDTSNIIKQEGDDFLYGGGELSAGEQVQQWLPDSKVVKAFNGVGAALMYKPVVSETPTMVIAGDDTEAKLQVAEILNMFGWEALDTGGINTAGDIEHMALIWIRSSMTADKPHAFKLV